MEKEYIFRNIGKRKIQEDNYVFFKFNDIQKNYYNCVIVFDGHGGNSNEKNMPYIIIKKKLYLFISSYFKKNKMNTKSIMDCFVDFDSYIKTDSDIDKKFGTCLSGVFISNNYIYLFNIGDVEYFLIDKKGFAIKSVLHNFKNEKEISRFEKNDCKIKNLRYRGLSVSRTIGDYDCRKNFETSLISCPSVSKTENNSDFIIILKTDGVTISNGEILKSYRRGDIQNVMENKTFLDNTCLVILDIKKGDKKIDKILYKKVYTNILEYL